MIDLRDMSDVPRYPSMLNRPSPGQPPWPRATTGVPDVACRCGRTRPIDQPLCDHVMALDAPTVPITVAAVVPAVTGTAVTGDDEPETDPAEMNRGELREECRRRGLSQRGTTADLRARLTDTPPVTRDGLTGTAGTGVPV